jgi:hypothetical protein
MQADITDDTSRMRVKVTVFQGLFGVACMLCAKTASPDYLNAYLNGLQACTATTYLHPTNKPMHTSMMLLCNQLAICIPSPGDHTLLHTAAAAAPTADHPTDTYKSASVQYASFRTIIYRVWRMRGLMPPLSRTAAAAAAADSHSSRRCCCCC